jgi:hypothetical protein
MPTSWLDGSHVISISPVHWHADCCLATSYNICPIVACAYRMLFTEPLSGSALIKPVTTSFIIRKKYVSCCLSHELLFILCEQHAIKSRLLLYVLLCEHLFYSVLVKFLLKIVWENLTVPIFIYSFQRQPFRFFFCLYTFQPLWTH